MTERGNSLRHQKKEKEVELSSGKGRGGGMKPRLKREEKMDT